MSSKTNLDKTQIGRERMSFDINNDLEVAEYILNINDLFFHNQSFYVTENNYWHPVSDEKIKIEILNILGKKYTQGRKNNILDIIKLKVHREVSEINLHRKDNALNINNGLYYLDTREIKPHDDSTKEKFATNLFPIDFQKDAKCERWMKFIYEIFEPDDDKYDKVTLLQEYLGYCLTGIVSYQIALLLLGNGSNGKSLILQVLEKILGNENYSNIELHQLSNKNYIVELQNKHVNFCSEIDSRSSFSSGIFKRIVAGETLTGDAKFKNPIKFQPYCKLIFATNDLPKTTDTTKGYFRRLLILKFNRSFEGSEKDIHLIDDLYTELPGIFNWMLEGLERLQSNKRFTVPPSTIIELEKYLESSNSVVSFINEKCQLTNDFNVFEKYDDLYRHYRNYCGESGDKPFKKTNFKIEIEKQYQGKIVFNRTGMVGNHFQGIKLTDF